MDKIMKVIKYIILTHGGGRFGNQLINYLHLTACGLEYNNIRIKQLPLYDYLNPINENSVVSDGVIVPLLIVSDAKRNRMPKLIKRIFQNSSIRLLHIFGYLSPSQSSIIIGEMGNNIGYLAGNKTPAFTFSDGFIKSLNGKAILAGWGFRNWNLVDKWRGVIAANLLNTLKLKDSGVNGITLGVHIRGTDFKEHADGQLYFNDQLWVDSVKNIREKIKVDKVVFMSDDVKQWNDITGGHKDYYISKGSAGKSGDMYDAFSDLLHCDYILTAGSTFALMAAWIAEIGVIDVSATSTNKLIKVMKYSEWSQYDNFSLNWK
jgi:hypothetical protein